MKFEFSKEQKETQQWARAFALEVIRPHANSHSIQKIKIELLEKLSKAGFMTLSVPESLGGLGLDALSFSIVIREISKVCGSVGVTVAVTNMIADVLVREGSDHHKKEFLSELVSGKSLTASFCLTENGAGSDARGLKTYAENAGVDYLLSGEKLFVTNGAFSGFFLVMAKTVSQKEPSAFLLRKGTPGLILGAEEEKMGLIGSSTIRLTLDQARVRGQDRLGPEGDGFKIAMRALDGGRISVASQALGIAEAALHDSIIYANERKAFGHSISDFQAIQWKLADMATALSASELLVWRAAHLKQHKKKFTREASEAKVLATESACRICDDAIQIHGGYGYVKDFPIERYYRDVRVTTLYEGTSEIQRVVIARDLLK